MTETRQDLDVMVMDRDSILEERALGCTWQDLDVAVERIRQAALEDVYQITGRPAWEWPESARSRLWEESVFLAECGAGIPSDVPGEFSTSGVFDVAACANDLAHDILRILEEETPALLGIEHLWRARKVRRRKRRPPGSVTATNEGPGPPETRAESQEAP